MNQPKPPKFPHSFVVKTIAIILCGLVALCIANPGVSACAQVTVMEVVSVSNLQRLSKTLKKIQHQQFLRLPNKRKPKKLNNK
jgi:phage host-nuclease inhibitor protein Gam